jgi:microcystin-dependent protein
VLGNTLSTITIGGSAAVSTINGLTLTSAGISYSGNTVVLGRTLSTITIGGGAAITTINGLTLTSSGISYSGNTLFLGNTITTISIGNDGSTTNLKGNVRITNTPTFPTYAANKAYVDMIELNTLYLSASTTLSVNKSTVTTTENSTVTSYNTTYKPVATFTLTASSNSLYLIKDGYIIVNIYLKLFNTNALTFIFNINDTDSTTVTLSTTTKTLVTAYIPVTSDTVISSDLVLTINAKSTASVSNAVTVYYDSSNSKLLFVNNKYPLHHQVYNPVGTIVMFGGKTIPPPGYVFCDGTQYSTSITNNPYYLLYLEIGLSYGSGSGTFAVPDLKSKFPLGSATVSTIAVNSVHTGGSFNIEITNMPAHRHTLNNVLNGATVNGFLTGQSNFATENRGNGDRNMLENVNNTTGVYVNDAGSGTAYYQPYTVVNYIIKY